jgi:hypothetical protein
MPILGPSYMFPVRNERVTFDRVDAPSLNDRMSVDEFVRALRELLAAQLAFR